MIVDYGELKKLQGQVAMVDGGFDPLHKGHIDYLRAACMLGFPLLCNVASDQYVAKKHRPFLPEAHRLAIMSSLESVSYVHLNRTSTEDVLLQLRPKFYVKGKDWEGKLPPEQERICADNDIGVVYLNTVVDSSTGLLARYILDSLASHVDEFEAAVHGQKPIDAGHYDQSYFMDSWREDENNYSIETRRQKEGRNPALIQEVFQPQRVLDLGCGPGALMYLLHELGVNVEGVDFSPSSKELAPPPVRDRIRIGPVTEPVFPENSFDLVICREVMEHLTFFQVRDVVRNIARVSSKFVYVTTRYHPSPSGLLSLTTQFDVDPTHITLLTKEFLRSLFVVEGLRSRPDLERRLDWLNKGRVLVFEKPIS